jgi:hypothetical protein
MLCWQFMVTLDDAIGLVLLAVMLGIVLFLLLIEGIAWCWAWLTDKVSALWRRIVY